MACLPPGRFSRRRVTRRRADISDYPAAPREAPVAGNFIHATGCTYDESDLQEMDGASDVAGYYGPCLDLAITHESVCAYRLCTFFDVEEEISPMGPVKEVLI